jgi:hypothetical protein
MTEHAYERYQRLRWNVAKREYLRVVERLAGRSFGVGET